VLVLLHFERRASGNATKALWIPSLWMLYVASRPLGNWLRQSTSMEEGSPTDRAFLIVLMLAALVVLARRKFDLWGAIKENKLLLILVGFMLISILWSNIPFISFKRWTRQVAALLMVLVVLSEPSPRCAIETVLRRMIYITIPFSLVLIKYYSIYGRYYNPFTGEELWKGVAQTKNTLGIVCIIAGFFLIWTLIRRWKGNNPPVWKFQTHSELLLLGITGILLIGSKSATAGSVLVIGVLAYAGFHLVAKKRRNLGRNVLAIILLIIMIIGTVTPFTSASSLGPFARYLGRDSTLTGRTDIWGSILPFLKNRLVLGLGFGGFWTSETVKAALDVNETHNGYLEVILNIGIVGLLLAYALLLSYSRKAQLELFRDFDWGAICACFLIMFAVHNITESSLNDLSSALMTLVLFLSTIREKNQDPIQSAATS
jgi:exopolysaccharide production protein ExoQ